MCDWHTFFFFIKKEKRQPLGYSRVTLTVGKNDWKNYEPNLYDYHTFSVPIRLNYKYYYLLFLGSVCRKTNIS